MNLTFKLLVTLSVCTLAWGAKFSTVRESMDEDHELDRDHIKLKTKDVTGLENGNKDRVIAFTSEDGTKESLSNKNPRGGKSTRKMRMKGGDGGGGDEDDGDMEARRGNDEESMTDDSTSRGSTYGGSGSGRRMNGGTGRMRTNAGAQMTDESDMEVSGGKREGVEEEVPTQRRRVVEGEEGDGGAMSRKTTSGADDMEEGNYSKNRGGNNRMSGSDGGSYRMSGSGSGSGNSGMKGTNKATGGGFKSFPARRTIAAAAIAHDDNLRYGQKSMVDIEQDSLHKRDRTSHVREEITKEE